MAKFPISGQISIDNPHEAVQTREGEGPNGFVAVVAFHRRTATIDPRRHRHDRYAPIRRKLDAATDLGVVPGRRVRILGEHVSAVDKPRY
jgi:hypothetical protein